MYLQKRNIMFGLFFLILLSPCKKKNRIKWDKMWSKVKPYSFRFAFLLFFIKAMNFFLYVDIGWFSNRDQQNFK